MCSTLGWLLLLTRLSSIRFEIPCYLRLYLLLKFRHINTNNNQLATHKADMMNVAIYLMTIFVNLCTALVTG